MTCHNYWRATSGYGLWLLLVNDELNNMVSFQQCAQEAARKAHQFTVSPKVAKGLLYAPLAAPSYPASGKYLLTVEEV